MQRYDVTEAEERLEEFVDRAAAGETITITRNGKPVAMLVAAGKLPPGTAPP